MSRRRRREHEAGRVRKTVEVLVSGLFGMTVVGVVLLLLQNGTTPSPGPSPTATVSGQAFPTGAADSGLVSVRSADAGTVTAGPSVNSPNTGSGTAAAPQGAQGAQETGRTEPATPATAPASGSQNTATSPASSTAASSSTAISTPSASASSTGGALGGLVGGLVGGVLGLL
jgi:hypothetical protein